MRTQLTEKDKKIISFAIKEYKNSQGNLLKSYKKQNKKGQFNWVVRMLENDIATATALEDRLINNKF